MLKPDTRAPVVLPLERIAWRAVGEEIGAGHPRNHLHASIACGGANLHVDAIEVATNDRGIQQAVDDAGTHWLDGIAQLTATCDILETVVIEGRRYVIVITPHGV